MSYQTTETPHGAYIIGPVPCDHLPGLAEIFKARGWDWLDSAIAAKLGATLAFVSRDSQAAWRAELEI